MPAYVIVDIEVTNKEAYQEYIALAPATVRQYGGDYIVRGGQVDVIEGDWNPKRLAILRFDTLEQAKTWYNSPEYTAIKDMRLNNTISKMIMVEGVQQPIS